MNSKEFLDFAEKEVTEIISIMRKKNADYTNGSQDAFANFKVTEALELSSAETGVLIRTVDKIQRIKSFLNKGKLEVANEGVEDACRDIIGYSLILLGLIRSKNEKV